MSLPEDDRLMNDVGLHSHYSWHNGSGGCRGTRNQAAKALPDKLREAGMEPDPDLMQLVVHVADRGERSEYELTSTWRAASDVIRWHIEARVNGKPNEDTKLYILRRHRPAGRLPVFSTDGRLTHSQPYYEERS